MVFKKGHKRIAGRKKGTLNKFTNLKEAFLNAFEGMGGEKALRKWGKGNSTDFYRLISRMLPTKQELTGADGESINVNVTGVDIKKFPKKK